MLIQLAHISINCIENKISDSFKFRVLKDVKCKIKMLNVKCLFLNSQKVSIV